MCLDGSLVQPAVAGGIVGLEFFLRPTSKLEGGIYIVHVGIAKKVQETRPGMSQKYMR